MAICWPKKWGTSVGGGRWVAGRPKGMPHAFPTFVVGWLARPTRLFGRLASPWSVNSQIKISPDKRPLFRRTVTPTGHSTAPRFPISLPLIPHADPIWLLWPCVRKLEIFHWRSTKTATWKGWDLDLERGNGRRMGRGGLGGPAPIAASFRGLLMMNARDGSEMVRNVEPKKSRSGVEVLDYGLNWPMYYGIIWKFIVLKMLY